MELLETNIETQKDVIEKQTLNGQIEINLETVCLEVPIQNNYLKEANQPNESSTTVLDLSVTNVIQSLRSDIKFII